MTYRIVDLIEDDSIWNQFIEVLSEIDDKLKDNYTLENLKLEQMICFTVLLKDDDIVCFSGLQKIEEDLYRVASRYYIRKKYREHFTRQFLERKSYNWRYLVPYQLKRAENKTTVFSTHLCKSDKSFELIVDQASKVLNRKITFIGEQKIFNVVQKVALIHKEGA